MEQAGATAVITQRSPFDPTGPAARLAELVAHLTSCPAHVAVGAIRQALPADADGVADLSTDDRLAVVAEAMLLVQRDFDLRVARRRRLA